MLKSLLQILFLLIVVLHFGNSFKFLSSAPPKIGISSWMTVERSAEESREWEHGGISTLLETGVLSIDRNPNGTTVMLSKHLEKIRIVCNASYPIRWISPQSEYRPDELYNYAFYVYDTRYASNVRDTKTFLYQSTLEIEESTSGVSRNFGCQSLIDPRMRRNLYIYWEGTTFLTYAGELLDARTMDNFTIVLPCTVNRPDVTVYLLKETEDGEREVTRNESIRYSPNVGFTLSLTHLSNPYGRYRCISEDDDESIENDERSVRVNVLHGFHQDYHQHGEVTFNESIKANASFAYEEELGKFVCCSSSSRAPNLKVIYCQDRITCKAKEPYLYKISNSIQAKGSTNGSCTTYELYRKNSGILRCRGDDIDIFKTYFTAIENPFTENDTIKVYYSFTGVKKEKLVNVIPSDIFVLVYSQQNLTAFCDASEFYFSKGIQWAVKWKNNSLQFLQERANPYLSERYSFGRGADFNTVSLMAEMDMTSLICYAPVWNSTEWVKKETLLNIKESKTPFVFLEDEEILHWELNATGKTIKCVAMGDPQPYVHWRKDNKTILPSESNVDVIQIYENGTSILNIYRVSHETQGEYICTGLNFAGEDQKHVLVLVIDPSTATSDAGLLIFIVTAVCFSLLLGMGFLVWKLKLQKNIIDHLAGVVFRDVGK